MPTSKPTYSPDTNSNTGGPSPQHHTSRLFQLNPTQLNRTLDPQRPCDPHATPVNQLHANISTYCPNPYIGGAVTPQPPSTRHTNISPYYPIPYTGEAVTPQPLSTRHLPVPYTNLPQTNLRQILHRSYQDLMPLSQPPRTSPT